MIQCHSSDTIVIQGRGFRSYSWCATCESRSRKPMEKCCLHVPYQMFGFDYMWTNMIMYNCIWVYMIIYDRAISFMIVCDHIWLCTIIYGRIWLYMISYYHMWSYVIADNHISTYMNVYAHIWSYMIILIISNLRMGSRIWLYMFAQPPGCLGSRSEPDWQSAQTALARFVAANYT